MKTLTLRLTDEEYQDIKDLSLVTGISMTNLLKQGYQIRKKELDKTNE